MNRSGRRRPLHQRAADRRSREKARPTGSDDGIGTGVGYERSAGALGVWGAGAAVKRRRGPGGAARSVVRSRTGCVRSRARPGADDGSPGRRRGARAARGRRRRSGTTASEPGILRTERRSASGPARRRRRVHEGAAAAPRQRPIGNRTRRRPIVNGPTADDRSPGRRPGATGARASRSDDPGSGDSDERHEGAPGARRASGGAVTVRRGRRRRTVFRRLAGEADYGRGAAPGASAGEFPSEPPAWRAAMASRAVPISAASR